MIWIWWFILVWHLHKSKSVFSNFIGCYSYESYNLRWLIHFMGSYSSTVPNQSKFQNFKSTTNMTLTTSSKYMYLSGNLPSGHQLALHHSLGLQLHFVCYFKKNPLSVYMKSSDPEAGIILTLGSWPELTWYSLSQVYNKSIFQWCSFKSKEWV